MPDPLSGIATRTASFGPGLLPAVKVFDRPAPDADLCGPTVAGPLWGTGRPKTTGPTNRHDALTPGPRTCPACRVR